MCLCFLSYLFIRFLRDLYPSTDFFSRTLASIHLIYLPGIAIMENCMEVPQKIKNRTAILPLFLPVTW